METIKFSSGKEMYDMIVSGTDLYNENEEIYVFAYNDAGALCYYYLNRDEATKISRQANESNDYWGAFLGFGGNILDVMEYDEYRYSDLESERRLYLEPSFDFCEECFTCDGWYDTAKWGN